MQFHFQPSPFNPLQEKKPVYVFLPYKGNCISKNPCDIEDLCPSSLCIRGCWPSLKSTLRSTVHDTEVLGIALIIAVCSIICCPKYLSTWDKLQQSLAISQPAQGLLELGWITRKGIPLCWPYRLSCQQSPWNWTLALVALMTKTTWVC